MKTAKIEFETTSNALVAKFTSNINVDDGYRNHSQGELYSEMFLYKDSDGLPINIDWEVYDKDGELRFGETIGLWFDKKTLTDYDGVFELPAEAIRLIRKSGYRVPRDFEPETFDEMMAKLLPSK